jgi:hypothetical protein
LIGERDPISLALRSASVPTPLGRVKLIAVLLLAFVLGAAAIGYGCHRLYQIAHIRTGPAVEGRAVGWVTRPSRRGAIYRVRYTFEVDGVTHTGGPVPVPEEVYEGTQKDPTLTVRYAAERPDWHLPEVSIANEHESAIFTALPGVFVCAFVVLGSLLTRLKAKPAPRKENFPGDPPLGSA